MKSMNQTPVNMPQSNTIKPEIVDVLIQFFLS